MVKTPADIRSLARAYTERAIQVLHGVAEKGTNESARVAAAIALLDRGWGKPAQAHAGEDDKDIHITLRHITEGRDGNN